ncbi:MAG: RNA methyltransferase [Flavipsychrobacter sp.]|nr:RNA methyltransferase [Flavipsychrobacter sp.]
MSKVSASYIALYRMLSKAQNKYIRSLTQQKYRKEYQVFLAEGDKIAREWLSEATKIEMIVGLQHWIDAHAPLINKHPEASVHIVDEQTLASISALQTPNQVLLVVHMPGTPLALPEKEWCFALDDIQDPGNMGTIIRIADWFGVKHIVCSPGCVDVYNSKVVQAAMGSHLRVMIHTAELPVFFKEVNMPVLAATLHGSNVYQLPKQLYGILVLGNESKGVSEVVMQLATQKITIPRKGGAESLNAGVSAGILCALLVAC